jgi:DNA-binding beta-propeller fold protein YncE
MSDRDPAPDYNQVWMGTSDTATEDGYFPVLGPIETLATATFAAKNTIGDYTKDAEDYLSTLILSDLSGGMNIEDMNEGSDTARAWSIFADTKRPGKISLNQRVQSIDPPGTAPTGPAYSCGQIEDTPYFLIGTSADMKCYGRNESAADWYAAVALNPDMVPVGKPVSFANRLFVPCGSDGYLIIEEADSVGNPGVPTLTYVRTGAIGKPTGYNPASLDPNPPKAVAFEVFDQKLWALTTAGAVAWSFTGSDDSWTWPYDEARGWYPHIQDGEDPQNLIGFYNPAGEPSLVVISDRGGYLYNQSTPPSLVTTPLKFPPHPDNGGAAAIWRAGEDLHIGMGLDTWRYTSANVIVPLSGLARDDGCPQELFGAITDLEAETSELFALIGPVSDGASGYVYSAKQGSSGSGNLNYDNVRGLAVDSTGSVFAADTSNERVKELNASAAYVAQFGSSGSGNGEFAANDGAYDIAVDGSDKLWVVDRGNHRVQKFTNAGVYESQIDGTVAYTEHAYTSQVGSAGSGNGQFADVRGIACDASGSVFACDTTNERVQKFSSALVYDSQFGSSGTGDGQFAANNGAWAIAIDASDNLWVVDRGNHRIQKFNNAGTYQSEIDGTESVTDWALQDSFGATGTGNSDFDTPAQVAIDETNGYVYVADTGNDRLIQRLLSDGSYSAKIDGLTDITGVCVDSSGNVYVTYASALRKYTSALVLVWTNLFSYGKNVATDGTHVYVTDPNNDVVYKNLCASGAAVTSWGGTGGGNNKYHQPWGIAVGGGEVYVVDADNQRVKVTDTSGAYDRQWTIGTTNARGCALDTDGNLLVAERGLDRIKRFDDTGTTIDTISQENPDGLAVASGDIVWAVDSTDDTLEQWDEVTTTSPSDGNGNLNAPEGIAIKQSSGRIYVADTANHRIEYFDSAGAYEGKWGREGSDTGQFSYPVAVAVNQSTGRVYVVDQANDRVQYFSATGTYQGQWGESGSDTGEFSLPTAIAVHPVSGNVFVMDSGRDDIQEFDADGDHISTTTNAVRLLGEDLGIIGSSGTGNGEFQGGSGLCFDADGSDLYTSDATIERIQRWQEATTDYPGTGQGNFRNPEAIAIKTSSGRVYVADTGNDRVQYFTSSGVYEGQWGVTGTGEEHFSSPSGIAVNQDSGDVYVLDTGNDRVQQFDGNGDFIRKWGSTGGENGQFRDPSAIAVHPTLATVYISDTTRDDIQIFSAAGTYVLKLGRAGGGDGEFNAASGLAFSADGESLYVSDRDEERVQKFAFSASTSGQTFPWLAAWTGIGWYGKKKFDLIGTEVNWMHVTATSHKYSLYLGLGDGSIHRVALRRYFENPRRALISGESDFEASGEIITPRFDAAMLGFWKIASHMVVFMDNATDTELITIEYQTDADETWVELGTVDSTEKTYLPFGEVDDAFSEGVAFNWIQFRISLERGGDSTQTPIIKSLVLCYLKIPQNANAFAFLVPFPKEEWLNRTGAEIRSGLDALITSRKFFTLRFPDQDGNEREFRGYLTAISGDDAPSTHQDGQRKVNFIQISDSEVA